MIGADGILAEQLTCALAGSDLPGLGPAERRDIADIYALDDYTLVVATDRAGSGGARVVTIPFKGEVVTRMATFWLDVTGDLAPSTVERIVDPQALLVRRSEPLGIGFAAHAGLTGRLWQAFAAGERRFGSVHLDDRLTRGAPLPEPIFLPVLRDEHGFGSEPLTRERALEETGEDGALFDRAATLAAKLFARGQELARQRNVELIDTLYGFGLLGKCELVVDALLHSPHLSCYRAAKDGVGRNLSECELTTTEEGAARELTPELRLQVARAYLDLGACFIADFEPHAGPVKNRLALSLSFVGILA
jgi:phosphoribosylaminoimidazole-succinocarboxamide synthase